MAVVVVGWVIEVAFSGIRRPLGFPCPCYSPERNRTQGAGGGAGEAGGAGAGSGRWRAALAFSIARLDVADRFFHGFVGHVHAGVLRRTQGHDLHDCDRDVVAGGFGRRASRPCRTGSGRSVRLPFDDGLESRRWSGPTIRPGRAWPCRGSTCCRRGHRRCSRPARWHAHQETGGPGDFGPVLALVGQMALGHERQHGEGGDGRIMDVAPSLKEPSSFCFSSQASALATERLPSSLIFASAPSGRLIVKMPRTDQSRFFFMIGLAGPFAARPWFIAAAFDGHERC